MSPVNFAGSYAAHDPAEIEQTPELRDSLLSVYYRHPSRIVMPTPIALPTTRDVDLLAGKDLRLPDGTTYHLEYPLHTPLRDPCPQCGAFNMVVGDYMYLGVCSPCYGPGEF